MKNRYIPFGYQIQNGDSVINTEQAATVQHIFYAYTEGQSFKEIAEYLTTSGTAYHFSDNSWNKNIVARNIRLTIHRSARRTCHKDLPRRAYASTETEISDA